MARKQTAGPTERELTILKILWKYGPCSVRRVNDIMNLDSKTGYTTTLKLMQIMFEKGLLKRDETSKTHVYTPAQPEEHIQKQMVGHFLENVFSGSAVKLLMQVISSKHVSTEELNKIKKLIDTSEKAKS